MVEVALVLVVYLLVDCIEIELTALFCFVGKQVFEALADGQKPVPELAMLPRLP